MLVRPVSSRSSRATSTGGADATVEASVPPGDVRRTSNGKQEMQPTTMGTIVPSLRALPRKGLSNNLPMSPWCGRCPAVQPWEMLPLKPDEVNERTLAQW